jgi:hypothetical protein
MNTFLKSRDYSADRAFVSAAVFDDERAVPSSPERANATKATDSFFDVHSATLSLCGVFIESTRPA